MYPFLGITNRFLNWASVDLWDMHIVTDLCIRWYHLALIGALTSHSMNYGFLVSFW